MSQAQGCVNNKVSTTVYAIFPLTIKIKNTNHNNRHHIILCIMGCVFITMSISQQKCLLDKHNLTIMSQTVVVYILNYITD